MKPKANLSILTLALCIGFVQLFSQLALAEGGIASGGGNGILCDDGLMYSYDYILTMRSPHAINPAFEERTIEHKEILQTIQAKLATKNPAMAASLQDFIDSINRPTYVGNSKRAWFSGAEFPRMNDESRLEEIPESCVIYNRHSPTALREVYRTRVHQAVIRTENNRGMIQYNVDTNIVNQLRNNSELQLSFLYIHEWLRDYTQDSSIILGVTHRLHSPDWYDLRPAQFSSMMRSLNFSASR